MDETKVKGYVKDFLNAHDWVWILQIYSEKLALDNFKDNSRIGVEWTKNKLLNWICLLWFRILVYVSTQIKIFNLMNNSSLQKVNIWTDKDFQANIWIEVCRADYFCGIQWELKTH